MWQIVLNKYRNELGRKFRKMYDGGGKKRVVSAFGDACLHASPRLQERNNSDGSG